MSYTDLDQVVCIAHCSKQSMRMLGPFLTRSIGDVPVYQLFNPDEMSDDARQCFQEGKVLFLNEVDRELSLASLKLEDIDFSSVDGTVKFYSKVFPRIVEDIRKELAQKFGIETTDDEDFHDEICEQFDRLFERSLIEALSTRLKSEIEEYELTTREYSSRSYFNGEIILPTHALETSELVDVRTGVVRFVRKSFKLEKSRVKFSFGKNLFQTYSRKISGSRCELIFHSGIDQFRVALSDGGDHQDRVSFAKNGEVLWSGFDYLELQDELNRAIQSL